MAAQVEGLHNLHRSCRRPVVGSGHAVQYNEPEVHHVREGQSVQSAIENAAAGDEIVIHSGVYREPLRIRTRSLWVHAAPDEAVEIHPTHNQRAHAAVTFTLCNMCKFEGISIKNDSGFAVLISRCSPELVNCKVAGQGGVTITKNNEYPQMHPVVRGCTVQRCRGPGILLKDAKAVIEDNTLLGNTDAAIAYSGLSNPWIKGNVIREGKGAGIAVQDLATGVIRDNTIEENECAGIMVDGMSQPTVWRNVIRDGGAEGLYLETSSKGIFEANDFCGNTPCDVFIGTGCDSIFTRNSFHDGTQSALIIEKSSPLIQQNSFHSYGGACITVAGNGGCLIKDNVVTIASHPGIVVGEHCNGVVEKNVFHVRPCAAPAATITTQKGSYVKVHDNVVKNVASAAPLYNLLDHVRYSDDSDTSVDPSNGLTHSEEHEEQITPKRRHSAFAERLQSMSLNSTRRKSSGQDTSHEVPVRVSCPAGSAGAAVHVKHEQQHPPPSPLTPISISDITFPTTTPTPSEDGAKTFGSNVEDKLLKAKTVRTRRLSDLAAPVRFKELRRSSMVVKPTTSSWGNKSEERTLRRSSSGLKTRSSSKGKKGDRGSRKNCPVSELTEAEVRAELEIVRRLLTADEQRQELQLLRNWLGSTRLHGKPKD